MSHVQQLKLGQYKRVLSLVSTPNWISTILYMNGLHCNLHRTAPALKCCKFFSLNATIRNDLNVDNKDASDGLLVNLTA